VGAARPPEELLMSRAARTATCCLALLVAAGCGVEAYEKRMEEAQKRLERFENESRVLDAPLSIPAPPRDKDKDKDKDKEAKGAIVPLAAPVAMIFLRPPKGINSTADNAEQPRARLLYSFKPRGATSAGPFTMVEVATGELSREFRDEVMRSFQASNTPTTKQRQVRPPGREPVTFTTTEFEDGQHFYSVNVWRGPQEQVIVAYWVLLAQKAAASRIIETSLETFAAGKDYNRQRELSMRSPLEVPPK
jgi:hypothetical protein